MEAEGAKQEWQPAEGAKQELLQELWKGKTGRRLEILGTGESKAHPIILYLYECRAGLMLCPDLPQSLGQTEQPKCPDFNVALQAMVWDIPVLHSNRGFHKTQLAR